ncbi:hypothetical protein K474DRAFT_1703658 [Panus rudis PR-1116 ss-1]|nr:hypothetical protein K474DRAFT_1703658 [Panus rudis PR-1116 ss-1]
MDRFLGPHTPEAMAHHQLTENWFNWDMDHPSLNETLIAGCASYQAFNRYLSGHDLYILPRSRRELVKILQRYAHDAIHNAIAKARSTLEEGGYSRICHLADESIGKVLDQNDNTSYLLELHRPQRDHMSNNLTASPSRHITIK